MATPFFRQVRLLHESDARRIDGAELGVVMIDGQIVASYDKEAAMWGIVGSSYLIDTMS